MATETDQPTAVAVTNGGSEATPLKEPSSTKPIGVVVPPAEDVLGKESGDDKDGLDLTTKTVASVSESTESVTDTEKKIRRAERFGISVKLSEEEKRNSRAERFGTPSVTQGSAGAVPNNSEELKRKSRAERFGLPVPAEPTDAEAKKKARLERFGSIPKPNAVEEDKKKARALRFAKPSSTSITGEGDVQPKEAIA